MKKAIAIIILGLLLNSCETTTETANTPCRQVITYNNGWEIKSYGESCKRLVKVMPGKPIYKCKGSCSDFLQGPSLSGVIVENGSSMTIHKAVSGHVTVENNANFYMEYGSSVMGKINVKNGATVHIKTNATVMGDIVNNGIVIVDGTIMGTVDNNNYLEIRKYGWVSKVFGEYIAKSGAYVNEKLQ